MTLLITSGRFRIAPKLIRILNNALNLNIPHDIPVSIEFSVDPSHDFDTVTDIVESHPRLSMQILSNWGETEGGDDDVCELS